ncbi:PulJ/GspJ family protein [Methylobacterium iners]|nr:prepilin-type cleavage/methylation domain-containing protein [Methylobacterium iners]
MAIGAVILVGVGSLLGLMSRQADLTAQQTDRVDAATRGLAAMSRDLETVARARWAGPGPRGFVFTGSPNRVLLALDRLDADRLGQTAAVLLQSSETRDGGSVFRAEAPLSPLDRDASTLDFGPARSLYAGPARVRFAYVGAVSAGGPELVLDDWPISDAMPVAVRIAFTDPASGSTLSSLRVPLRIEAEPGCAVPRKAFCSRVDDQAGEGQGEAGAPLPDATAARGAR